MSVCPETVDSFRLSSFSGRSSRDGVVCSADVLIGVYLAVCSVLRRIDEERATTTTKRVGGWCEQAAEEKQRTKQRPRSRRRSSTGSDTRCETRERNGSDRWTRVCVGGGVKDRTLKQNAKKKTR